MSDRLLARLAAELEALRVPRAWRERVLAEARDHLEHLSREGAHPEDARRRFGDPADLARLVAAQLATSRTRTATYATFGALALAGVVFVASLALVPIAGGWPDLVGGRIALAGPVLALALLVLPQVAFVSGSLALLGALRTRREATATAELALLRRRSALALATGGAALVSLLAFAVDSSGTLAGWWIWATVGACALTAAPLAVAGVRLASSSSPVALASGEPGDVFDDLAPLFAVGLVRRLALPEHPWRFAALAAAVVGLAGLAAGWYGEGDPGSGIVRGGFEAVALLICFALLGRFLGLRRSSR
jgi:hypothetical protein